MSWTHKKRTLVLITMLLVIAARFLFSGNRVASAHPPRDVKNTPTEQRGSVPTEPARAIRADVQLVLVNVSVIDPDGRFVTGLRKESFSIYEDKRPQTIAQFSSEDTPISIGLLFDASGSMSDKIDSARIAVMQFLRTANPADEFFLIGFNDRPFKIADFTQDASTLMTKLNSTEVKGRTSLLDAVYLGLNEMRKARYSRKALLIVSDGGDNHSRYGERDIKQVAQESDLQIYAVGIHNLGCSRCPREELEGPWLLEELTEMTGGRHFMVENLNDLLDVAQEIGQELRNVYTLGYVPRDEKRDGKWHKIKVKLIPLRGLFALRVFARSGYYAPQF